MLEQTPTDRTLPEWLPHARWALEPLLAVVFVAGWLLTALRSGGYSEAAAILLLAAAIGVCRISPGTALGTGVLAVLLQIADLVPRMQSGPWSWVIAGAIVFFAAGAYGSRAVRWFGLAGAVALSMLTAVTVLAPGVTASSSRLLPSAAVLAGIAASYLGLGALLATVLAGAWLLGLTVNHRAADVRSPFETWLMRPDAATPAAARAVGGTGVFRPTSRRQLTTDIAVAVVFCVLGFLSTASSSATESAVLLVFAVALGFRRVAPPIALAVAWVAALLQMLLGLGPIASDIVVLVVLYATAAYGRNATRWAGLVSVGAGALFSAGFLVQGTVPLAPLVVRFVTVFVASAGVLGLAWTLGLLARTWGTARESRLQEMRALDEQRATQRAVVVEQERNRIARDMHDVVAHSLAVVIAQADGARYARATDATAVDSALVTISATARDALADVRILLAQLRQDDAQGGPQPTIADLGRLVEQMRAAGLAVDWRETGAPVALGSGAQLAVYRIIQEALTNALRHGAHGGGVALSLRWDDAGLGVDVENALDPATGGTSGDAGHGLPGMRERAVLAGGSLFAGPEAGRFRVRVHIPRGRASGGPAPGARREKS